MNNAIKELNSLLVQNQTAQEELKMDLQKAWNLIFDDLGSIKELVEALDKSNVYVFDRDGGVESYIHFDLSAFDESREYFKEYMRDTHFVEVDFLNNSISSSVGAAIVINNDGDVYDQDSGKFFVSKDDYVKEDGLEDIDKRDSLIEEYMEKTGCYPGVFKSYRYGSLISVDTSSNKVKK